MASSIRSAAKPPSKPTRRSDMATVSRSMGRRHHHAKVAVNPAQSKRGPVRADHVAATRYNKGMSPPPEALTTATLRSLVTKRCTNTRKGTQASKTPRVGRGDGASSFCHRPHGNITMRQPVRPSPSANHPIGRMDEAHVVNLASGARVTNRSVWPVNSQTKEAQKSRAWSTARGDARGSSCQCQAFAAVTSTRVPQANT